jgi:signal transduction histidine kinase
MRLWRSLRWRLLLGGAAAILLSLGLAWLFMTLLFERHLERRLQDEMTRDALQLVAALSLQADGSPRLESAPDDPRFQKPAGGYYWEVSTDRGVLRSRSLWDSALAVPADAPSGDWRMRLAGGPFESSVFVLERRLSLESGRASAVVQLAQDRSALTGARREFGLELAGFLAILWAALSLAAWAQVALGLRPLRTVRGDLARLKASASERLPEPAVDDVRPLVEAINALADARERDLTQARRRAADLAHGLKTPLAALAAQSRRAREQGAASAADGMERALAAIGSAIDGELARARIAAAGGGGGATTRVLEVVERLVTVLEHTELGGALAFAVEVPASLTLPVRGDDLAELLGPVLENAVRYARRQLRVRGESGTTGTCITVEDDGPGIPADRIETALSRGGRLDESQGGSGLGLAIAQELVAALGGDIRLGQAGLGGLEVRFRWPAMAASAT